MLLLSNSNAQTLGPGQSMTFDTVILHTGCAECHRKNSGSIILKMRNAIYEIGFNANIGANTAAEEASLAISFDGAPLLETRMISTTITVGDLNNVACSTLIPTECCCGGSITVTNVGTTTVTVGAYPRLSVKRSA